MRYLQGTPAQMLGPATSLWNRYNSETRVARGLTPQQSLDRRDGVILPLAQAVTTSYVAPIVSDDGAIAAIPLLDEELAARAGVNTSGALEEAALDERIRTKLVLAFAAAAQGAERAAAEGNGGRR